MKKSIVFLILIQLGLLTQAQYQTQTHTLGAEYYLNPVFAGDNPDPSILCDGNDYYMVHSSFDYYPGLLIWHSTDLINWMPVTNALNKYIGSVWAPDLVKYNNNYFIYFPANNTNYVVSANTIQGPWSDPIDLKVGNIDPGHVADDEGNRYLYFSSGAYVPLSKDGLSVTGELKHSYDGWPIPREWSIEGFFMEGPKLVKHGDYYYLTVAEGGTAGPATGHMVISARSKTPIGPWENSPYNPIARTKTNTERWCSVGHGTVFEDASSKWWLVLHGYENDYYNMGRQTSLLPLEWTNDGWFKVPDGIKMDEPIKKPKGKPMVEHFSLNDKFEGPQLELNWKFFGEYDTTRFHFVNSGLKLKAKGTSVADCAPLLCIPTNHSYTAQVEIEIEGNAIGGLVLFYNEKAYSGILADNANVLANLRGWQFPTVKNVLSSLVYLRIKNIENTVDMYYSTDGKNWIKIEHSVEVSAYHHNVLSGFLSLRLGLCAIGEGFVKFKNFEYQAL